MASRDDAQAGAVDPARGDGDASAPASAAPPMPAEQFAALCRLVAESLGAAAAWIARFDGERTTLLARHGEVARAAAAALARRVTAEGRTARIADPTEGGAERVLVGVAIDPDAAPGVVLGVSGGVERLSTAEAAAALARFAPMVAALLGPARRRTAVDGPPAPSYQERLFAQAESMAHFGSFVHEGDGRGVEWSEEMFNILDWPAGPPLTLDALLEAFTEEGQATLRPAVAETLATGRPFDLEATLVTGRGQLKVVRVMGDAAPSDGGRRLVGIAQDITERRQVEDRNWRLANHDFLTRLPNRRLFEESLERSIERARINGGKVGLLLVDLDYFKEVNASLGHETGDVLLHVVAGRLRRSVGSGDEVARIGGDEFAVLVHEPEGPASLVALSRKILQAVEQGVPIRENEVAVRASIGGALFPDHARGVGEILESAQAALARAKTTGRRIALVYEEEMRHEGDSRFRIHEAIRGALARDEIFPYYQSKVNLQTGEVLGLEALVRWRTGPNGLVFPAEFGSALSDGFLGSAIATRVLEKVTDDIRDWLDADLPFGSVAVNVTAIELTRGAYHEQVAEVLQRKAIPFDRFQVEVTETVFLQFEGREIRDTIAKLNALGVKVALDDFGTGFGSLVHLRRLAVSQIKIDRSFIERIDSQPEDVAIVKALIALGKDLGKRVIAEGIEREEERQALLALGCAEGQGFLFGIPLPKAEMTRRLEAERDHRAG